MTTKDHSSCAIWPEFPAKEMHDSNSFVKRSTYYDSPRAGGKYEITEAAADRLRYLDNAYETRRIKARLTTWLVEMRRKGEEWPIAETDVIEQSVTSAPFDVDERAMRLLHGPWIRRNSNFRRPNFVWVRCHDGRVREGK